MKKNIKRITDYNYMHSATRVSVENSIGRLKGKWRRLKGVRLANPTRLRLFIRAAIVLHNFCLNHDSDPLPPSSPSRITRLPTGHNTVNKRDNICKWLARQNWAKAACLLWSKIYYLCQYKLHICKTLLLVFFYSSLALMCPRVHLSKFSRTHQDLRYVIS